MIMLKFQKITLNILSMKQSAGNNIKLGIIVTFSITLFILVIYFIGQKQQLFSTTFHVSGIFKDINGLKIGNNVRFSGINVGVVENIEQVTDSTVKVSMLIDENSRRFIKKNAKAVIAGDGMMGDKIMQILPGVSGMAEIENNDVLATSHAVNIDEIMVTFKETLDNAESITGDLAFLLENMRMGNGTMGRLFMDTTLAQNLDATMVNIKEGTGGFKQNMDAAGNNILLRGFVNKKNRIKKREEKQQLKEEAKEAKDAEE